MLLCWYRPISGFLYTNLLSCNEYTDEVVFFQSIEVGKRLSLYGKLKMSTGYFLIKVE